MRNYIQLAMFIFLHEISHVKGYNLALKKPTWQSSISMGQTSDKAVDGKFDDRSIEGNQCAISGGVVGDVVWYVDLESIQSIQSITIIYRTDGILWRRSEFPSHFLGFSVYVSNTTNKDNGILYFHDTQYTIDTIPSSLTINKFVLGRYVTYYNTRDGELSNREGYSPYAYLDLCEVQVHGCPFVGFYGETCSQRCPVNCQICNMTTGECISGCTTGFEGARCEKFTRVCENSMYGPGCSVPCGNCLYRQGEQCHHVTGQCPRGCLEGYSGEKCTEASDFWRDWTSENLLLVPLFIVIPLLFVSVVVNIIFGIQLKKNKVTVQEQQISER